MKDWRKLYSDYITNRLEEYGYEPGMCPQKYTAYTQVSGVVKLRLSKKLDSKDVPRRGNNLISETFYNAAIKEVDAVLPSLKN